MDGEKEEKEESIPFSGEQRKQIEVGIHSVFVGQWQLGPVVVERFPGWKECR